MFTLLVLLTLHTVGDFVLQSDWMALNKSKSWRALLWHTGVYSTVFLPFGLGFTIITFILHTLQDAITSRITGKLWFFRPLKDFYPKLGTVKVEGESYPIYVPMGGNRHYFFVMIGLDQLIHFWSLAWTYTLFK